jgi:hypothetical protein
MEVGGVALDKAVIMGYYIGNPLMSTICAVICPASDDEKGVMLG